MKFWKWSIVNTEQLRKEQDAERKRVAFLAEEQDAERKRVAFLAEERRKHSRETINRLLVENNENQQKIFELERNYKDIASYHYALNEKYKKLRDSK